MAKPVCLNFRFSKSNCLNNVHPKMVAIIPQKKFSDFLFFTFLMFYDFVFYTILDSLVCDKARQNPYCAIGIFLEVCFIFKRTIVVIQQVICNLHHSIVVCTTPNCSSKNIARCIFLPGAAVFF
jgi:hypothetical protein